MLISIDGLIGRDLVSAAKKSHDCFSTWDASGIFYELGELNPEERPSARTLLLLYAADIRFRLRWQIQPALEEGKTVVAAPYVESGIAFGRAAGLPRRWVTELFRFAPKAGDALWIDNGTAKNGAPGSGFVEFCSVILRPEFNDKFTAHFKTLERRGKCRAFR